MIFQTLPASIAILAVQLLANSQLGMALPQVALPSSVLSALAQASSSAAGALSSDVTFLTSAIASAGTAATSAFPAAIAAASGTVDNNTFADPSFGEGMNGSLAPIPLRMVRALNSSETLPGGINNTATLNSTVSLIPSIFNASSVATPEWNRTAPFNPNDTLASLDTLSTMIGGISRMRRQSSIPFFSYFQFPNASSPSSGSWSVNNSGNAALEAGVSTGDSNGIAGVDSGSGIGNGSTRV